MVGVSCDSNSSHLTHNQQAHEVISITDYSDLERLSSGSLYEVASSKDYSFNTIFSNDDVEGDHAFVSVPTSSQTAGTSSSSALLTSEMHATIMNKEDAK